MDIEEYREIINNFSFNRCDRGNQGYNRILIQLFSLLGHGKSSFINTCKYVWEDREYKNWAKAYGTDGGLTAERIPYELTRNITLVDNRGLSLGDFESAEVFAQLGNLLPLGEGVKCSSGFDLVDVIVRAEKEIKPSDLIVPVYVHSVKKSMTPEDMDAIKKWIHEAMRLTGSHPMVVLTHKTSGRLSDIEATFRDMGVERIFSFENYTPEDHLKTKGRHEEVLKFLYEVIKDVQFWVDQLRDPEREIIERKQFVFHYIHDKYKEQIVKEVAMQSMLLKRKLEKEMRELEERADNDRRLQEQILQYQREMHDRQRTDLNASKTRAKHEKNKSKTQAKHEQNTSKT